MLVSGRAEAVGGESDYSAEEGMCDAASPASHSLTPSISPSPPPPPPVSIGARRAADLASPRRNIPNMHCRVQATNSALSYTDSDSCPQCRERYAHFKRNNSVQSATTCNSYTDSLQQRKGTSHATGFFCLLLQFFLPNFYFFSPFECNFGFVLNCFLFFFFLLRNIKIYRYTPSDFQAETLFGSFLFF